MVGTEPLSPDLMARLMPKERIVSDTRHVVYYYRASPDGRRILFGGRVSLVRPTQGSAAQLRAELVRLFPNWDTRISHSWLGFVAYTLDELVHVGRRTACITPWATAARVSAWRVISACGSDGRSEIRKGDCTRRTEFPTRPFYWGNPWFLAPSICTTAGVTAAYNRR